MVSMLTRIQQRRGVASQWIAANPILAQGEIGLEVDTNTFKLGNGLTRWIDLPYLSGPPGASAYNVAVINGFSGTEAEWLLGLSGYGIAVANGFSGTQAEWLTSLVGDQGIQGVQGATGPIGLTGATGIEWQGEWDNSVNYVNNDAVFHNGASWFASGDPDVGDEPSEVSSFWYPLALQGATGSQGVQGVQGATGSQGIQGDQGIQGEQGVQGDTGSQGLQGDVGPQGDQGIQGEQGVQGIQGDQGIQGVQGDQGIQGEQGIQGDTGATGAGLNILGTLNDETELPSTGSSGDAYIIADDLYIWDGSPNWKNVGQIVGPAGANVTISSNAPAGPIAAGALWYDQDDGSTYIYYNDVDSSQWIQL